MRKDKLFPCSKLERAELFLVLSLTPTTLSFFISRHQKLSSLLLSLEPSGPMLMSVCMCVSGRKTPLIRCHVVLEAVTCQGSSQYLSVTTCLLSVCGWLGTVHLNTHICCSSMARTTERSAIKMTLTVNNKIQSHFRSFLTLRPHGQKEWFYNKLQKHS